MEEKAENGHIREAIETCIEKAESILQENREVGDSIRGLLTVYADSEGVAMRTAGHSLALETAQNRAVVGILGHFFKAAMNEAMREEK